MTRETQTEPSSQPLLEDPRVRELIKDSEQWFLVEGLFLESIKMFASPAQSEERQTLIELEIDTSLLPSNLDVRIGREVTKALGEYEIFAMIGNKESRRYRFSVLSAGGVSRVWRNHETQLGLAAPEKQLAFEVRRIAAPAPDRRTESEALERNPA